MKLLHQKAAERELLVKEVKELFAKGDAMTEEDFKSVETKNAEIETKNAEIDRLKKLEEIEKQNADRDVQLSAVNPSDRPANAAGGGSDNGGEGMTLAYQIPAKYKMRRPPKVFLSAAGGNIEDANKLGYGLGMYLLGSVFQSQKAQDWCRKNGIEVTKAQAENVNPAGGFLVPEPLSPAIITLAEQFGVVRRIFRREVMTSDTLKIPRTAGILGTYWLSDGQIITPTQQNYDMVTLTANKLTALILRSSEVSEDAIIDFAAELAKRIAWAYSAKEDQAGFLGDGTSQYGGFIGVCTKLLSIFGTGESAGIHVGAAGTGASTAGFLLKDFNLTQAKLPQFAWEMGEPVWVMSRQFYASTALELASAGGGNTIQSIMKGPFGEPEFLGSPVVFSQIMPQSSSDSTIMALFGNFELGAAFGDRKELTIAQSTEYAFSSDQIALRGIERVGINVHDVGGANAASQGINPSYPQDGTTPVAGPIVALATATS